MNQFDYQRALFASQMSTNARMTGVVIGSHYNWKTGEYSFVSNKTIARETNLSVSSITRARRELVDNGYLLSERRYDNSCVMTPIIPESITYGHKAELKDTLKDNLKDTLKDTKSSIELLDINILSPEEYNNLIDSMSW